MCEHHDQLLRVKHEFDLMRGTGVIDLPRIKQLLEKALNERHT